MFTSVDPAASKYPGWGSYVYCRNNPVKYVDPDGDVVETVVDVASVGLSGVDFYNEPTWANAGWLALDIACAIVPFVPAVGVVRHAGKLDDAAKAIGKFLGKGDDVIDAAKAADATADVAEGAAKHPGRLGGPSHRTGVEDALDKARVEYPNASIKKEGRINTPGGQKPTRYGDVVVYEDGKPRKAYQVGNTLSNGVTPVKRERQAISDVMRQGVDVEFLPKK